MIVLIGAAVYGRLAGWVSDTLHIAEIILLRVSHLIGNHIGLVACLPKQLHRPLQTYVR